MFSFKQIILSVDIRNWNFGVMDMFLFAFLEDSNILAIIYKACYIALYS